MIIWVEEAEASRVFSNRQVLINEVKQGLYVIAIVLHWISSVILNH